MMFSVYFDFRNILSLIINTQSFKHNNILNPTIKCFMLDYKYTEPLTRVPDQGHIKEFKGIISQDTFRCTPMYIQMYPGKVIPLIYI